MKRTLVVAVACLSAFPLHAQFVADTAFVRFSGDTVKICHINYLGNCNAKNITSAEIRSDTIFVVESDTSLIWTYCDCLFDFTTSLVGLDAGNYVAVISTASRGRHPPAYDTLRTRWTLPFRIIQESPGPSVSSSVTPCHDGYLTPAWTPVYYPLQFGNVWEYAEDLTTYTYQTSVAGDTLMPNGRHYAMMKSGQWISDFVRQQGDSLFRYSPADSSEQLLYDFTRVPGDTIFNRIHYSPDSLYNDTTSVVLVSTGIRQLFGRNLRYWSFYKDIRPYIDDEATYTIADSIGLFDIRPGFGPWGHLRGARIDGIVYGLINGIQDQNRPLAGGYELVGNYPNPFNPVTVIKYTVGGVGAQGPGVRKTRLAVYDLLGREVATLVNEAKAPGSYEVRFDGSGLASGVYLYRLTAGSFVQCRTMVLLK